MVKENHSCLEVVFSDIVITNKKIYLYRREMKKLSHLKNKKITVMGLGLNRGGLGVTRFLTQSGARVLVTDLKKEHELQETLEELKDCNIKYVFGQHRIDDFVNRDMIIQNPAVPHNSKYLQIARSNGIPIETDLSLFLKICPSENLIAVGGTKGKTTVTNLIYHIFSHVQKKIVHAGNMGISVFDILPSITPETLVLLEISSWQLEGLRQMKFKPSIAVLTNILPDHLDRYNGFDDYANSEKLIYKFQDESDYLVTNFDNPVTKDTARETAADIFWFSTKKEVPQGTYLNGDKLIFKREDNFKKVFSQIKDIQIPGIHNIENVLASANVCFIHGLLSAQISNGIKTFSGIPNRLEKIRILNGIHFYNDTCATTPDATMAAINSFSNKPLILILGGKDKKLNYEQLCQTIKKKKNIGYLIILQHPEYNASDMIYSGLKDLYLHNKLQFCSTMSEAVQIAFCKAKIGTYILLSPAATSFGMFRNEFERGKSFRQTVEKLG